MAIVSLSVEETSSLNLDRNSVTKYPWRTTEVGASFFVPRSEFKKEDYRPTPPEMLKSDGWKFKSTKFTHKGEAGILVRRVA